MAIDKTVDSTQLNADLTSVANAIRTKGGTSASLDFPADFVTAIGAIPTGGGGPDLSSDTVTAGTLLEGITAHDASGSAITGTLTGEDLFEGTLQITAINPDTGITISRGLVSWNASTKKLRVSAKVLPPGGGVYTFKIPTSYTYIAFTYSSTKPLTFSDFSSSVTLANGGNPITIGNQQFYLIQVSGSASNTRSFTVSNA